MDDDRDELDPDEDDDEAALFRRAVTGARPLERADVVEPPRSRPAPRARFRRRDEQAVLGESLDADIDELEAGAGERLSFRRPEVGPRTLRRLSRGRYSVQAELDLHGMTADQAAQALEAFIRQSLATGHTCVRIVHGKGRRSGHAGPVLKVRVNRWLRRFRDVLAFTSARQVDGGTGALYVLLRGG